MFPGPLIQIMSVPEVDPHWASVSAILGFDEEQYSITDPKGVTWGMTGPSTNATTTGAMYGSRALSITSAGDRVTTLENQTTGDFENGDFTVELAFKFSSPSSQFPVLIEAYAHANYPYADTAIAWQIYLNNYAGGGDDIYWYSGANTEWIGGNNGGTIHPYDGNWHTVAYSRGGSIGRLYFDGVNIATNNEDYAYYFDATRINIGSSDNGDNSARSVLIDEVRITKGVARYTDSSYTPRTIPFPRA